MPELLFATSNRHKADEVRAMLGEAWTVRDLSEFPDVVLPPETGTTFEANAIIKAEGGSVALPEMLVLADDSGLEVDVLDGAPGVWSARYAGEEATDGANRVRLKTELWVHADNDPKARFSGRFRCCMVLARGGKAIAVTNGAVEGQLIQEEQGVGGFGYDPLFIPEGHEDTFGVLPETVKNQLSHRARALGAMIEWLNDHPEVVA
jgi:XTP/dITP diphosphohydrolase